MGGASSWRRGPHFLGCLWPRSCRKGALLDMAVSLWDCGPHHVGLCASSWGAIRPLMTGCVSPHVLMGGCMLPLVLMGGCVLPHGGLCAPSCPHGGLCAPSWGPVCSLMSSWGAVCPSWGAVCPSCPHVGLCIPHVVSDQELLRFCSFPVTQGCALCWCNLCLKCFLRFEEETVN